MLEALLTLDPTNSRILGRHFQELADQLLARASIAARDDAADERRRQCARSARQAAAVGRVVERGTDPEDAIGRVAARHAVDPAQVRAWLEIEQKKTRGRRRLRNVQIMRLAARGWSDAAIAAKYRMHAKSVNRIVRRMLRENPPSLPELETGADRRP